MAISVLWLAAACLATTLAEKPSVGQQVRIDFPQTSLRRGNGAGGMSSVYQTSLPVHNAAPHTAVNVADPRTVPGATWGAPQPVPSVPGYTQQPNSVACGDHGFMRGPDGRCWRIGDKPGSGPGPTNYQALVEGNDATKPNAAQYAKLPVPLDVSSTTHPGFSVNGGAIIDQFAPASSGSYPSQPTVQPAATLVKVASPSAGQIVVPPTTAAVPSAFGFGPGRNYSANSGIWQVPTWHVPTTQSPYRYLRFNGPMYQYPKSRAAIQAASDLQWHKEQRKAYRQFLAQLDDAHTEHRSYVRDNRVDVIDMVKGSMDIQLQRLQGLEATLQMKDEQSEAELQAAGASAAKPNPTSGSSQAGGTSKVALPDVDSLINQLVTHQEAQHRVTYNLVGAVRDLLAWDVAENINFKRSLKYARSGVDDDEAAEEDRLRLLKLAMESEHSDMMHLTLTDKKRMQADLDAHTSSYLKEAGAGRQSVMESDEETSDASASDVETKAKASVSASSEESTSASSEKSTSASEADGKGEARSRKVISAVNFANVRDALVHTVNAQSDADGKTNDDEVGRPREGMGWHGDSSLVKSTPFSHGDGPAAPEPAVQVQYGTKSPGKTTQSVANINGDTTIDAAASQLPQLGIQRDDSGEKARVSTVVESAQSSVDPAANALPSGVSSGEVDGRR